MPTSADSSPRTPIVIQVFGHVSAQPGAVAKRFGAHFPGKAESTCDLAIFAVNPAAGIDAETIEAWQGLSAFQVPRLVVVTSLEGSEADFDDAVLIANRVFDQLITPYLVLHSESGSPVALISLETQQILDFTTNPSQNIPSDLEHQDLISDFRDEYLEMIESSGEGAFEAGLLFPAIPLILENNLGVEIIESYIARIAESPGVS